MNIWKTPSTLVIVSLFAAMVIAIRPVSAANVFVANITGTGARNFTDPATWLLGAVPTTADQAVIDQGDGINDYVYLDSPLQIQRFNIGNQQTGGLELRNGAYLFLSQSNFQVNVGPGQPGFAGVGYLRIKSGATLEQSGLMYIGLNPLGVGTVTLEEGGTHIVGGDLAIRDGTGTYNMLGGSVTVGGFFQVARNGTGTFTQSGGTLQANRTNAAAGMFVASNTGSHATYEISGGSLTVASTNAGVLVGNSVTPSAGGAFGIFRVVGSAPTINVASNFTLARDSRLETAIGATGISTINVGGTVNLFGDLGVSFSATPSVGQHFTIMNYGTLSGTFASFNNLVDSPLGPNTVHLSIDYGTGSASSIQLIVDSLVVAHAGDFNGDGKVDGADFVIWQTNFPKDSGGTLATGDANGDGKVDGADFVIWQTNFPYPSGGASPVPEPNGLLLLAAASAGLAAIYRNRNLAR